MNTINKIELTTKELRTVRALVEAEIVDCVKSRLEIKRATIIKVERPKRFTNSREKFLWLLKDKLDESLNCLTSNWITLIEKKETE